MANANGSRSTKKVKSEVAPKLSAPPSKLLVNEESIARRAYALFEAEGRPEGRHLEHWLKAEAELRA